MSIHSLLSGLSKFPRLLNRLAPQRQVRATPAHHGPSWRRAHNEQPIRSANPFTGPVKNSGLVAHRPCAPPSSLGLQAIATSKLGVGGSRAGERIHQHGVIRKGYGRSHGWVSSQN
jgi:hypothetical protein